MAEVGRKVALVAILLAGGSLWWSWVEHLGFVWLTNPLGFAMVMASLIVALGYAMVGFLLPYLLVRWVMTWWRGRGDRHG